MGIGSISGAAEAVRAYGIESLTLVAHTLHKNRLTIGKWWRDEPELFEVVMLGFREKQRLERIADECGIEGSDCGKLPVDHGLPIVGNNATYL